MKPIARILVTIDLDLATDPVLELAIRMAAAFGAQVEVIHIFETPGYHGPAVLEAGQSHAPELEHWRTARLMVGLLDQLAAAGFKSRGRMAFGVVEEEVSRVARDEAFDLIIIGSHSRQGLDRLMAASVAAGLIRLAHCPVLVLPHVPEVIPG